MTDAEAALDGLDPGAPRIVMLHDPSAFSTLPLRRPGAAIWPQCVTCGIGFSVVPARIIAPPQLLVVMLEAAS